MLVISFLTTGVTFSQNKTPLKELLSLFSKAALPYCIDFKNDTISYAADNIGTDSIPCIVDYVSDISPQDSVRIPVTLVKAYLLQSDESIYNTDQYGGFDTTSMSIFVPIKSIVVSQRYYCLIFSRFYSVGLEQNAEKYVCMLDRKGNLISKVPIASYTYSGTYIHDDCDNDPDTYIRVPYYDATHSCIDVNFTITEKDANDDIKNKYSIDSDGRVIELKRNDN